MTLKNYSFTALIDTDPDGGNVVAGQAVTVNIKGGGLASIYEDDAGATPIAQPGAVTDSNGVLSFYIATGTYTVTSGSRTEEFSVTDSSENFKNATKSQMEAWSGVSLDDAFIVSDRANGIFDTITKGVTPNVDLPNGYNIIESTADATKCFVLRVGDDGAVDIVQLGASGSAANDPSIIQFAVDTYEYTTAQAGTFYAKNINWPISEGKTFLGAGQNSTKFINDSIIGENAFNLKGTGSGIGIDRVAYAYLAGFTIEGNPLSGHGIYTDLAYENKFERIEVIKNGGNGIYIERGFYSELKRITAKQNGTDGVHFGRTANGNLIVGGHFGGGGVDGNGRAGVYIGSDGDTTRTHGVQVIGAVFESNDQFNILIDDASGCFISGNYIESAAIAGTTAQVSITDSSGGGLCRHNQIQNNDFFGDIQSITLSFCDDTIVSANSINFGMTINATCNKTRVMHNPQLDGTFTDNGLSTIVHQDPTIANRWYKKNGTTNRQSTLFGGSVTRVNYGGAFPVDFQINGTDVFRIDNSDFSFKHFFTAWDRPFILGSMYLWVEGKNLRGKEGSAPTNGTDGNIIGTAL